MTQMNCSVLTAGCQQLTVNKLSSVTSAFALAKELETVVQTDAQVGDLVAVMVTDSHKDQILEQSCGRVSTIYQGDIIVGCLGSRRALKGTIGSAPATLHAGMELALLNQGGVIGLASEHSPVTPLKLSYLGHVYQNGKGLNLADKAINISGSMPDNIPLILVAGSIMNSGKTRATIEIIKQLTSKNVKVAAGKISGVACRKDLLAMLDAGASKALSFVDCGYPSTVELASIAPLTKQIIVALAKAKPQVIILECGDGVLGGYNVASLFTEPAIKKLTASSLFCCSDFVSAWGGAQWLQQQGIKLSFISGPITDTIESRTYLQQKLGLRAFNSWAHGAELAQLIIEELRLWHHQ